MNNAVIAFIGGGNMGRALVAGLIADGYPARDLRVGDPDQAQLDRLRARFSIQTTTENHEAISGADVVVLAVKPQVIKAVVCELADSIQAYHPLVLSLAAGIRSTALGKWLGPETAVVRVMPNTPALVGSGAAALYATQGVRPEQRELAESILRAVGLTLWIDDEGHMDAVTALSGSGPAYFFLLMEALEDAATHLGLSREQARLLTIQTAFGAAKMALESSAAPAALRVQVTSPGGTTERALQILKESGIDRIIDVALRAAAARAAELARTFGDP